MFDTCSLEEVGISENAVKSCLRSWEAHQLPMHSFLIIRHGKLVGEYYWEPYTKDTLHRLYSITKSFVSLAVGYLEREGKLKLDDPVISYFPEYVTDPIPLWLSQTTIRHMLKMASCHSATTYKKDLSKNWVESFFKIPPDHKPGMVFSYDTSSSHTLCALVEKLTGMELLEYLRKSFLNDIGFSQEAYILKDPFGISMGGSGLMAKPRDMAKIGLLLLQEGKWKGKQLLPQKYLKMAVSPQIANCVKGESLSQIKGYGYQFWCLGNQDFACWGKGGQWILCFPRQDLVLVTTADTEGIQAGDQRVLDGILEYILPSLEQKKEDISLKTVNGSFRLKTIQQEIGGSLYSLYGEKISGIKWKLLNPSWISEVSVNLNVQKKKLQSGENEICSTGGSWLYRDEKGIHEIKFGFIQPEYGRMDFYEQPYSASGTWLSENTLYIRVFMAGEEPCQIRIQMVFSEEECTLYLWNTGEMKYTEFSGWYNGKVQEE